MADADDMPQPLNDDSDDQGPLQPGDGHDSAAPDPDHTSFQAVNAAAVRAQMAAAKAPRVHAALAFDRAWRRIGFRIAQAVALTFSGIWAGCILMSGVAAALTFRTIPAYEPTVGAAPYSDPLFAQQAPRIIAGGVAQEIFKAMDIVQLACVAAVVAAVGLQATTFRGYLVRHGWSIAQGVRLLCLLTAVGIFAWSVTTREPMHELREKLYDPGITEPVREKFRAQFDSYHKTSERLAGYTFVLVLVSALATPFASSTLPDVRRA